MLTINQKINEFETLLGYQFNDKKLLKTALTHKSYAYQNINVEYNERLEFLGDAILEHIISIYLYNLEDTLNEGNMTKKRADIVCEKSLAEAFLNIKGDKYILLGRCEDKTKGRTKPAILADAFEAVIGAIYLDSNFETASEIALKLLSSFLNSEIKILDYKTLLQERLQKNGNISIEYKLDKKEGPDHDAKFYVSLYIEDKKISSGCGKTLKKAHQEAARKEYEANTYKS